MDRINFDLLFWILWPTFCYCFALITVLDFVTLKLIHTYNQLPCSFIVIRILYLWKYLKFVKSTSFLRKWSVYFYSLGFYFKFVTLCMDHSGTNVKIFFARTTGPISTSLNLAQCILGWMGFKFIQMRVLPFSKGR